MPADADYISGSNMVSVDDTVSMIPRCNQRRDAPRNFRVLRDAAHGGGFCA